MSSSSALQSYGVSVSLCYTQHDVTVFEVWEMVTTKENCILKNRTWCFYKTEKFVKNCKFVPLNHSKKSHALPVDVVLASLEESVL